MSDLTDVAVTYINLRQAGAPVEVQNKAREALLRELAAVGAVEAPVTDPSTKEITDRVRSLQVTVAGQALIANTRADFIGFAEDIIGRTSPGRARSIALTKLEEAAWAATRAIAEGNKA